MYGGVGYSVNLASGRLVHFCIQATQFTMRLDSRIMFAQCTVDNIMLGNQIWPAPPCAVLACVDKTRTLSSDRAKLVGTLGISEMGDELDPK